ncbi:MAG TPA: WD40 repeat domain-containing protein [Verrucomicrobiae bacterium]
MVQHPLAFVLSILFAAFPALADVVTTSKRLFGLGDATVVAASPDLRYITTGGQGGAFLWNATDGTLLHRLDVEWWATALAFSPTTNLLAVATRQRILLFDTESGKQAAELLGHDGEIYRLTFSPDGQRLISASSDNTARVWSIATGLQEHQVHTPGSPIGDVSISRDGQKLATVDTFLTNCVKIWDVETERLLQVIPKTNWTGQWCRFAPDGNLLVVGSDRTVVLWNAETAVQMRAFTGVTGAVSMISDLWMPNDQTLAAIASDGNVYLWNFETAALTLKITGTNLVAAAGVPGDFLTVSSAMDWNVRLRQLPGNDVIRTFKGHTTSVQAGVAFSPDGRYVLTGGTEISTRLWDRKTAQPVREFTGTGIGTMAAIFSPNGSNILTTIGLPTPGARLWNTESGELIREFRWTGSWPMGAIFSPDGTKIAVHEQVGNVRIFDVTTGASIRTLASGAFYGEMAFSPNAPLFATTSGQSGVALFNYVTGQHLHTFFLDAGPVSAVEFSPDGQTLLIAWSEGGIHLFNPETFALRREFPSKPAFLEAVKFSPNGKYLLTGEGWPLFTATLWDAERSEELRSFAGHKWVVSALAFSANNASILTGAELVREWSIADLAANLQIHPTQITWSLGQLQHTPNLSTDWQTLTNASPYPISKNLPTDFFRLRLPED